MRKVIISLRMSQTPQFLLCAFIIVTIFISTCKTFFLSKKTLLFLLDCALKEYCKMDWLRYSKCKIYMLEVQSTPRID